MFWMLFGDAHQMLECFLLHLKNRNLKWTLFSPRPGVYLLSDHVRPQRSQSASVVEDTVSSSSISPHSSQHNRWLGGRGGEETLKEGDREYNHLSFDTVPQKCSSVKLLIRWHKAMSKWRKSYYWQFFLNLRSMILCFCEGFNQSNVRWSWEDAVHTQV